MSKLAIDRAVKTFGSVRAVDGVSLQVEAGETIVLLGPSGCGKTTLLRLIAGFMRPDGGSISIAGRTVASDTVMVSPERRLLSMVFQSYAVWPHKTVFENLAYGLKLRRLDRSEITRKVAEALATVKMQAFGARYPAELSGGQQQRVALARALVLEPEILLFDEPLSNLDAGLREHMRFEIKSLIVKHGITSIYVTHDQHEAMVVADRIAVMNQGRIEQIGTAEDLYHRSTTEFVARFIGLANVLDATVVGVPGPGVVCLDVPGIGQITARAVGAMALGQAARLVVRPESMRLGGSAEGRNAISGVLVRRSFLGSQVDLALEAGGQPLRVIVPSRDAGNGICGELDVSFAVDDCFAIAAEQRQQQGDAP